MRCLTLAEQLFKHGAESFFMCKRLNGDLVEYIKEQGYPVYELLGGDNVIWKKDAEQVIHILENNKPVQWLVMDHYCLDAKWEEAVRPYVGKLMVIDDLADRPHDCDLLLDQNLYRDMEHRYKGLIPEGTDLLLGPSYTLLREEFISRRPRKDQWDGEVRRLLVSFGGSDPTNETMKTLRAVSQLKYQPKVDVVIGRSYPYQKEILSFCREKQWVDLHIQTKDIALLMEKADLVIGAGGSSVWERCYMKLPSLIIETASNQSDIISFLKQKGAIVYLGKSDEVNSNHIATQLQEIMAHPDYLKAVRKSVKEIMKNHHPYGVSMYMMGGGSFE
ncbi:UDP-2,4-diacetamido-2,4,6-trideoxy-beta-L-altropyranose hydrolase [Halobacillus sp. GSS1]|uniref:UDP-2,4-diacetamido-2,4, 6-trideoxy-beta-L-altropyranose hydrolase n=1 Tax=Halobacillus sp. GSS1 TaxID=2815919 RepID=UPI001F5CDC0F|nr:UDP-2,4-diacetamido-2,4,6-trideoxy-beta-L-altropyranose hydrolase [Halobacillus sp. GSS1]